jgi:hypothetical protein
LTDRLIHNVIVVAPAVRPTEALMDDRLGN